MAASTCKTTSATGASQRNAMKYHVAMIVSVLAAVLLIGGACVQTVQAERKSSALKANLSALSIQKLTTRFWECQPHTPGEPYKRDAVYCAEVNWGDGETRKRSATAPSGEGAGAAI